MVVAAKALLGEKKHLVCTDHKLSRMTVVAIESSPPFQEILVAIRRIVTFFKQSVKASDHLRSQQLSQPGASEADLLKLIRDEPTRWTSTFEMLDRFILLAGPVSNVLLNYTNVQMLTGSQLAAAKEGRDLLKPIAHVITDLEGEKYSLSGKVIPMMKMLKKVNMFPFPPKLS